MPKASSVGKGRTHQHVINVRFTPDEMEALRQIAIEDDRSAASFVRRTTLRALAEMNRLPASSPARIS